MKNKHNLYAKIVFAIYNSIFSRHIAETDRSRKHGMEEYINADPITFDHHKFFQHLQRLSLDWRLNDPYASLVGVMHLIKVMLFANN